MLQKKDARKKIKAAGADAVVHQVLAAAVQMGII